MRAVLSGWRPWPRLIVLGALAGGGVAGCSSDTSRFSSLNSNPFESRSDATGSVPAAPASRISSQSLPPPPTTNRPATVASTGVSGGGQGMGSYTPAPAATPAPKVAPPPAARNDITGSIPRQREAREGWKWDGGTAIVVGSGETADSLARKYGVPAHAILQANNLTSASAIHAGQRLVIPRFDQVASASAPPVHAHVPATTSAVSGGHVHVVAPGDTLMSLSRRYHKPLAQIASANKIAPGTHIKVGDRIIIPGKVTVAQAAPTPAPAPATAPQKAQPPAPPPSVTASVDPTPSARIATSGTQATAQANTTPPGPAFRWPLRGRVIGSFGQGTNGQRSDGIDLAVPEGTAVHAAEDGVVAYAGNELKGYGNLILIRHSDGFVTAYAHASEIMVKRNDQVRRGQVIAKSGQSGGVSTPQLHFEIRKGSSPVDPAHYLPAGGA